ncbi:MAG: V-type ATPase subunit [Gemmatimonadota bacterium]
MTRRWEDLVARVRGLSGHLLGRSRLTALAETRDLVQLNGALEDAFGAASGFGTGTAPEQIEVAVRRIAARYLRVIARWAGTRTQLLAPLFLDEDRRSVRALVRGAAGNLPPNERLAGLVPTPTLPERALEELASQMSVSDVVALLVLWGHPFGTALLAEARRAQPDLLRIDLVLNSEFATRAVASVRRAPLGTTARRDLRIWVEGIIDLENAFTALQLAGQRTSLDPAQFFIPGGRALEAVAFTAASNAGSVPAAAVHLGTVLRDSTLAPVFAHLPTRPIEDAALDAELRRTATAARRSPLGAAPVISFFTRLRAEVHDLRLIIWRVALGAGPAAPDDLVTIT